MRFFLVFGSLFLWLHLSAQIVTSEIEVANVDSTTIDNPIQVNESLKVSGRQGLFIDTRFYGEKIITVTTGFNVEDTIFFAEEFDSLLVDHTKAALSVEISMLLLGCCGNSWNSDSYLITGTKARHPEQWWTSGILSHRSSHSQWPNMLSYHLEKDYFIWRPHGRTSAVIHLRVYAVPGDGKW